MTNNEKMELILIPILAIGVWLITPWLPAETDLGLLLLYLSAIYLLQSLLRDISLLIQQKKIPSTGDQRTAQCLCVESTIGIAVIVAGAALLGTGITYPVVIRQWGWSVLVTSVLISGFIIKDYVIERNPWRIYRDKAHMNIIFKPWW